MQSTSVSLLKRVKNREDREAWSRLVDLYAPLVYTWGRRAGLDDSDASDLTQEVLTVLAQQLPEFEYDSSQSFRGWLKTITTNRAKNFHRAAASRPAFGDDSAIRREADPAADIRLFERNEYASYVVKQLLATVRHEFRDDVWEAFRLQVFEDRSAEDIAKALGMTRNSVYLAKSRVLLRLREVAERLLD